MNKVVSPRCTFCELYEESIEHLFFECIEVKSFWLDLISEVNDRFDMKITLKCKDIVCGYEIENYTTNKHFAINIIILYAKQFIYRCKMDNRIPKTMQFQHG